MILLKLSNTTMFAKYFVEMLKRGVYLAPEQFEAAFVPTANAEDDIEKTNAVFKQALANG